MWTSRIFSLAGRPPSAHFVSQTKSQLCRRTFVAPAITAIDRGNAFSCVHGSKNSGDNNLHIARSNINSPSNPPGSTYFSLPFYETRRCMSKYLSKAATKRLPLNTKRAKKGYYKGKGSTSEGRLTSKGKFIANPLKKLQLVVPDLEGFTLKPYIARSISKSPPENRTSRIAGQ
mmetsp:Transcript_20625/g.31307  ORF Transcript_20625/g.31307 Transcript_20625/m.31307 type:complete len:174 (+) Transcript_20625:116-637(+)